MTDVQSQSAFSDHRTMGWLLSIIIHLLIIFLIFFLPHFTRPAEEEAYEGILVSFGLPVESTTASEANQSAKVEVEEDLPEMEEVKRDKPLKDPESSLTQEESAVVVQKTEEAKPAERRPSKNTVKEPEVTVENKLDKAKDSYSQLFNKSENQGNRPQQSGDPLGEPDASILEGISKGKGRVGGGLDERGVLKEPNIVDHSQKSGKVVVRVCVDRNGNVLNARYTQKGSTTTDRDLVEIAEISAMKYKFMKSEYVEQCGTITINFIVQ